jgi:hypothetical protein
VVLAAILTIPLANYAVYKSRKASNKQKMQYVSLVTILLGFLMVVLELQRIKNPLGLSSRIDAKYQRNHDISSLNLDYFDTIAGFDGYQDWPFCVSSNDQLVNLQRLLKIEGNRIVYQMPDSLFRDQGIYQTLKSNEQLSKTLLVEIGTFESGQYSNMGNSPFSSLVRAGNQIQGSVVSIEDVPFIGAELNFDRILGLNSFTQNLIWIRLGKLSHLDKQHVEQLIAKLSRADDPNDPGYQQKLRNAVILISMEDNMAYGKFLADENFAIFNFYSCYERRQIPLTNMLENNIFANEKNKNLDKIKVERLNKQIFDQTGDNFKFIQLLSENKNFKNFNNKNLLNLLKTHNHKGSESYQYVKSDPTKYSFLKNLAKRMTSGLINGENAKNIWLDYGDVIEVFSGN